MKPAQPMIEQLAEAYWNEFRRGFMRVGGTKDYPTWRQANDPVKSETLRCLRHAVEVMRANMPDFDRLFPDAPHARSLRITPTDEALAAKVKT